MNLHETSVHDGKVIVDGKHLTYFSSTKLIYVRDGDLKESSVGPHFLDIGFAGSCDIKCFDCHMKDRRTEKDLPYDTFNSIVEEYKDSLCQVALGGAGNCLGRPMFGGVMSSLSELEIPYGVTEHADHIAKIGGKELGEMVSYIHILPTIGISADPYNMGSLQRAVEVINIANDKMERYDHGMGYVIHLIVNRAEDIKSVLPYIFGDTYCLKGLLLLAPKSPKTMLNNDEIVEMVENLKALKRLSHVNVAMDECLAQFVSPYLIQNFGDLSAIGPCESGKFTAYVHSDGSWNFCSGNDKRHESWDDLNKSKTKNKCKCLKMPDYGSPPNKYNHKAQDVVVRRGPFTNSSSSCYFVMADQSAKLKLDIYPLSWRKSRGEFSWYEENKRLVELSVNEWGATCAAQISYQEVGNRKEFKKKLDNLTWGVLNGTKVYYLVANRDDSEIQPTSYEPSDICDDTDAILLMDAGEEH